MTLGTTGFFDVVITRRRQEAANVISLELARASEEPLPAWTPGAHIDVRLPSGLTRQYSLCGRGEDTYLIAVLREPSGRGGSAELHAIAEPGTVLSIRGPRNQFPLVEAQDYLLLAGGIGITPILAIARQLCSEGKSWRLFYGGRSRPTMAFLDDLGELEDSTDVVPEDEHGLLDLQSILASVTSETAIYCCGPPSMIQAAEACCSELSLGAQLHIERFISAGEPKTATQGSTSPFEVELSRSGQVVTVGSDQTILAAVRAVLPDVPASCEDGFCGTCETTVLDGTPEHHDDFLSADERESNKSMMICVGRAKTPRLVLDL